MGSEKLKKKVALITGGASGIGLGIAEKFVKEGANVVLADLDEGNLKESKAKIGDACAGITTNVTMEEDMKKAVDFAVDTFGSLDIGVNAAGAGTFADITDLAYEEFFGDHHQEATVLQIETDDLDYVRNPEALKFVENRIRQTLRLPPFQQELPLGSGAQQ